ncbi:MAG: hypothetical protein RLY14_350 [Planctomycetota bacterium]|jgi:uncharacterized membrane protein YbhN (UPF0104 family)
MTPKKSQSPKSLWKKIFQWTVCLIVVAGFAQATRHAINQLYAQQKALENRIVELDSQLASADPSQTSQLEQQIARLKHQQATYWHVSWPPVLASMACYTMTILLMGFYWYRTLHFFHQHVPFWPTLRIFFFGQLAKYIPGKAMVIVVRVGMMRPLGAALVPTTVSVFMETLGAIGIGAAMSVFFFLLKKPEPQFVWLAITAFAIAFTPTIPPIFNLGLQWILRKKLSTHEQHSVRPLSWSHFLFGWYTLAPAWCFAGLSLFFALQAFPAADLGSPWNLYLIVGCIGTACLAAVAGFVSFMPGGAGVRELVLMFLLEPLVGGPMALAIAIWFRLITLASELIMAGVSLLLPPRKNNLATPNTLNPDPSPTQPT